MNITLDAFDTNAPVIAGRSTRGSRLAVQLRELQRDWPNAALTQRMPTAAVQVAS
jgi:hypothetical protein